MKKAISSVLLAGAAFAATPASAAWEYCLDIICDDCTTTPDPQQLRVNVNWETNSFRGIVQANDGSWGVPAVGKIMGDKIVFARYNRGDAKQYLYVLDANTFSGKRMQAAYKRVTDDTSGEQSEMVAFSGGDARSGSLSLSTCPMDDSSMSDSSSDGSSTDSTTPTGDSSTPME